MLLRSAAAGLVPVVTTERSRTESGIMAAKLVRGNGVTKAPAVQIRAAPDNATPDIATASQWDEL
jgi:hypothetical protein